MYCKSLHSSFVGYRTSPGLQWSSVVLPHTLLWGMLLLLQPVIALSYDIVSSVRWSVVWPLPLVSYGLCRVGTYWQFYPLFARLILGIILFDTVSFSYAETRWYSDTQALIWMPPPATTTDSNIWPCSDLDLAQSTFKMYSVRLTIV